MFAQASLVNPLHRGAIKGLRFAGKQLANEEFQVDGFFRIGVGNFHEEFANRNFDAQFLADFTDKALLKSFARFALAAGKLPQSAKMRPGVPLSDEEAAGAKNERGADFNAVFSF